MPIAISTIIIILCSVTTAYADPRREADEHARRGVALYNLGKFEESIHEFEQAYTLFQSDALLFNLAQAHRQLQHCERALYYYRRFLEGTPSPTLTRQVEKLLPKLEAACQTKLEPPGGPVSSPRTFESEEQLIGPAAPTAGRSGQGRQGESLPTKVEAQDNTQGATRSEDAPTKGGPSRSATISITAALSAGMVTSGKSAPATGARLTITSPLPWQRSLEIGGSLGVGHLWRGDASHSATTAQLTFTARYHSAFGWGRFTLGGELGGAYFSSLDASSGVVPGTTRAAEWIPMIRAEVGVERVVSGPLAIRVATSVAMSPRTGPLLSAVGQIEFLLGLRYQR